MNVYDIIAHVIGNWKLRKGDVVSKRVLTYKIKKYIDQHRQYITASTNRVVAGVYNSCKGHETLIFDNLMVEINF